MQPHSFLSVIKGRSSSHLWSDHYIGLVSGVMKNKIAGTPTLNSPVLQHINNMAVMHKPTGALGYSPHVDLRARSSSMFLCSAEMERPA